MTYKGIPISGKSPIWSMSFPEAIGIAESHVNVAKSNDFVRNGTAIDGAFPSLAIVSVGSSP